MTTNTPFPLSYGLPEPDMEKEVTSSSSDSDAAAAKPAHDDVWRQCACGSGEPVAYCEQWRYCG